MLEGDDNWPVRQGLDCFWFLVVVWVAKGHLACFSQEIAAVGSFLFARAAFLHRILANAAAHA
jgi:hypothetical protein